MARTEELLCFFLDEGLEASLINGQEVGIRKAALVWVKSEIISLERLESSRIVIHIDVLPTQEEAIAEVCAGV